MKSCLDDFTSDSDAGSDSKPHSLRCREQVIRKGSRCIRNSKGLKKAKPGSMQSGDGTDEKHLSGHGHDDCQEKPSFSSPVSSTMKGCDSKSLKVPQGVIVRTPSGRDYQGRKTPPRFFTITNEELQRRCSSPDKDSVGRTPLRFIDTSQDRRQECSCKSPLKKAEMTGAKESSKSARDYHENSRGLITLQSLLEAEIRTSITDVPKVHGKGTHDESRQIDQPSSPSSSTRRNCTQNHAEKTSCSFDEAQGLMRGDINGKAVIKTSSTSEGTATVDLLSTTELFTCTSVTDASKPQDLPAPECKVKGTPNGSPYQRPATGSLLDMLLSCSEPLNRASIGNLDKKSVNKGVKGKSTSYPHLHTFPAMNHKTTKTSSSPSTDVKGIEGASSREIKLQAPSLINSADLSNASRNSDPIQITSLSGNRAGSVPKNAVKVNKASAAGSAKAESNFYSESSKTLNNSDPNNPERKSNASMASLHACSHAQEDTVLTQCKKSDLMVHSSHGSDNNMVFSAQQLVKPSARKNPGTPCPHENIIDDGTTSFGSFYTDPKKPQCIKADITTGQEKNAKCSSNATLFINPVTTSAAAISSFTPAGTSKGQSFGLIRSASNTSGPVVLVTLGSNLQNSNESTCTTPTGSGKGPGSVKPETTIPVRINSMALTGNINTDAFNLWKSCVRKAYKEKYGENCEYYMHNQWVSMTVAQKSPYVHQVKNRVNPPIIVQSSSNHSKNTREEVVVINAPTRENSKPDIQRQIKVIPRLQISGSDQLIDRTPATANLNTSIQSPMRSIVSSYYAPATLSDGNTASTKAFTNNCDTASDQDVMGDLYKRINMADLSSDFPMTNGNYGNSTFRKLMKRSNDFLGDPGSSLDPVFAKCLLSGRQHEIDNWMAMKSNWRETPEWIVGFLAECENRKRARKAAIDAGVMRRVAMVQRMARSKTDDDEDVSNTSKVQTPQKTSGKCLQFGESKDNAPACHEKMREDGTTETTFKAGTTHVKKNDKCGNPAKVPYTSSISSMDKEVVESKTNDRIVSACRKTSYGTGFLPPSSTDAQAKPGPSIEGAKTSHASPQLHVHFSLKDNKDFMEGAPTSQDVNNVTENLQSTWSHDLGDLFGDLDLINDEELWNIQCDLFPPWQRVSSFISADAAADFFKSLDKQYQSSSLAHVACSRSNKKSQGSSLVHAVASPSNRVNLENLLSNNIVGDGRYNHHTEQPSGEGIPITSTLMTESTSNEVSTPIAHVQSLISDEAENSDGKALPKVKRRLFSENSLKGGCQQMKHGISRELRTFQTEIEGNPKQHRITTNEECFHLHSGVGYKVDHGNRTHAKTPLSREDEEDAAVSKLLEILDTCQKAPSSERFDEEKVGSRQNGILDDCRSGEGNCDRKLESLETKQCTYQGQGTNLVGFLRMGDEKENYKGMKSMSPMTINQTPTVPWVTDAVETLLVESSSNEMMGNEHQLNNMPHPRESQRNLFQEINRNLHMEGGSDSMDPPLSSKEDGDITRRLESWHEEIKPIIAFAIESSSSAESNIMNSKSEDVQRTTPTEGLNKPSKPDEFKGDQKCNEIKTGTRNQAFAIQTTSSSSAEYVTADETDTCSGGRDDRRTPDLCIKIKTDPSYMPSQGSSTLDLESNPLCTQDSSNYQTAFEQYPDGGTLDVVHEEEVMTQITPKTSDQVHYGRTRKKTRQGISPDCQNGNGCKKGLVVVPSSSNTSMTSSSGSSSSQTSTRRKGRGKKRRRRAGRRHMNSGRRSEGHEWSSSTSQTLMVACDKNDSEGDAPNHHHRQKVSSKRCQRTLMDEDARKVPKKEEKVSPVLGDTEHADHVENDEWDDESSDESTSEPQSPTSPRAKVRRSTRLKIRRVSSLPCLRSERNLSDAAFQKSTSRTLLHTKVVKKGSRKV